MQYTTGTVQVTLASNAVVGTGTLFLANVAAGDIFTIRGSNVWYDVGAVVSDTSLTLSANYAGASGTGSNYAISRSFSPEMSIPYIEQGDVETAAVFKRAILDIETLLASRLVKSVAGGTDVTLTAREARSRIVELTGLLTASINLIVPAKIKDWIIYNNTTGAFTLTVKPSAGAGIVVGQTKRASLYSDGTNVVRAAADV